ncbi:MAG TPA: CPBP family intramembrane glutamic endopeptidase [Flavobacteriaceae bacterium]|nr:CPBP family intramembrane glutamic endopeptidase [Flavobacteriaceae bacterium]
MFLDKLTFRKKAFGYYLLGSFIIIVFNQIGTIPLIFSLPSDIVLEPESNPMDIIKLLPSNLRFFLLMIPSLITVPGIWLVVVKLHELSFKTIVTTRKKIDYNKIIFSFLLWGTVVTTFFIIGYFITPENYELNFKLKEFLILSVIAILLVPVQTTVEELVFRGYLMQGFGGLFNSRLLALFFTSIIFGLLHLANPEVAALGNLILIQYLGYGFTLGIMTLMDDGLELAIGSHAANNLVIILLATSSWTVVETESIFRDLTDPEMITPAYLLVPLIIFPIILYVFARKYSWKDWYGKLVSRIN